MAPDGGGMAALEAAPNCLALSGVFRRGGGLGAED